jgi:Predicted flavin-nucleotide-binding protein
MPSATARTRVRRLPELALYDQSVLYSIIDAAYVCHISFYDGESSHCIPTACWRDGDRLYVHGSNGGRLIRQLASTKEVSVAITLLDGLVLAKSAFNHAMNYRSAIIYGRFDAVNDEMEKLRLMDVFMRFIAPGRERDARQGNAKEFAATTILGIALDEAAAKVRTGGPSDDESDLDLPIWAGVLPMAMLPQAPVAASTSIGPEPVYVRQWQRSE